MRDRKRRSKTKNGVFRSGFFDQKKYIVFFKIRPDLMRDRKRRSKTKNGVFRSEFFDQKKKLSYLKKSYIYFFRSKNLDRKTPFFVFVFT